MKTRMILAAFAIAAAPLANAQGFPDKPIHFVVPFTAGRGTDIVARTVGGAMSRALRQPILLGEKPRAGGAVGAAPVAKRAPHRHTAPVPSAGHVAHPAPL